MAIDAEYHCLLLIQQGVVVNLAAAKLVVDINPHLAFLVLRTFLHVTAEARGKEFCNSDPGILIYFQLTMSLLRMD